MFGYDWSRLHAALNDLPSALLLAAVIFDLLGASGRRPAFRQAGFWTLLVGTVGAIAAVLSGLQAEKSIAHGGAVHEVMEGHEQLALITLGVFGVLALWRIFRDSRMGNGERLVSTVASIAGVGILLVTAGRGGDLVFEHAAGIPSPVLQAELRARGAGHEHAGGEDHDHPMTPPASDTAATAAPDHLHPPGTPPHSHAPDSAGRTRPDVTPPDSDGQDSGSHSHSDGTPPHQH